MIVDDSMPCNKPGWCVSQPAEYVPDVQLEVHSTSFLSSAQVWVDIKFAGAVYNSEQFNTAGRSIGTGLLAVDIVSHWTWASIILQSASYGYFYGTSGSYWWASSATASLLCPASSPDP